MKSTIRLRMSAHDAHYGGNLVDGARNARIIWRRCHRTFNYA